MSHTGCDIPYLQSFRYVHPVRMNRCRFLYIRPVRMNRCRFLYIRPVRMSRCCFLYIRPVRMSRCCLPRSSKRPHCCPRCSARNRPAAFSPPRPSLPLYCRSSSPRRSPSGCRCCSFPCSDSGKFRHCLLRLDSHSDQAKKNPLPVKHHPVPFRRRRLRIFCILMRAAGCGISAASCRQILILRFRRAAVQILIHCQVPLSRMRVHRKFTPFSAAALPPASHPYFP